MITIEWQPFHTFFDKLRQSADTRELLERLLHGLVKMLRASRGFVLLRRAGADELVNVASYKFEDEDEFKKISRTVSNRALDTGEVTYIEESSNHDWFSSASQESLALLPRAILCGPLIARGQAFGVVYIDGHMGRTDIDESKKSFFQVVVMMAAELVAAAQTRRSLLNARDKVEAYRQLVGRDDGFVIGQSPAGQELDKMLKAAAGQDVSVLITGETGTGKEMVARALHGRSARQNGPFVPVNCAALPRDIIESELFGAEKGAYTGANERRIGRFELASGGTLFLDEIGELDIEIQVKLLRVLQERKIRRVGGHHDINLDIRLICATNRDLEEDVRGSTFRQDLYFRINVFRLHLVPLRERVEDIMPLAEHFLDQFANRFGKDMAGFSKDAIAAIKAHPWPGNIRELRNAIERAAVIEKEKLVKAASLPLRQVRPKRSGGSLDELLELLPIPFDEAHETFERAYLVRYYEKHEGNIAAFSRETGIPRNTLYRRLARYDIVPKK